MKYSLSDIIKDLLAKIPVLENRINTLSKKITVLNSKYDELYNLYKGLKSCLDGNEFVKSKNGENNIALKYEQKDGEDKKTLHAYVDGVEVPLGSQGGANISVQTSTSNVVRAVLYGNYGCGSEYKEGEGGIYGGEWSYLKLTAVKLCTYPVTHKKMRLDADGETAFINVSDTNGSESTFDLGLSHEWSSPIEADTFSNQCYDWVRAQIKAKYPQYTSIDIDDELTYDGQEDHRL